MTEIALFIFLALIPGFIALLIISTNIVHKKFENIIFLIYSSILGLFSYVMFDVIRHLYQFVMCCIFNKQISLNTLTIWTLLNIDNKQWKIDINEIVFTSLISILLSIIVIYFINHKIINKFLKLINATTKYGDESLFYYFLNSNDIDWVYIRDTKKEQIIQGRVESFSEYGNYQEVVLYNVSIFSNDKKAKLLYTVPNLYLCYECGTMQIEKIPEENFK